MGVITIVTFLLVRFVPGDIIDLMVSLEDMEASGTMTEADIQMNRGAIEKKLGLDQPAHVQYLRWLGDILRGDLGASMWTEVSVGQQIRQRLPITFELGAMAFIIGNLIAFPIGIISAIRQDSWMDYLGRSFALLSLATPAFWLGTLIFVFPSIWWQWSPSPYYVPFSQNPGEHLIQFLIPAILMGTAGSAGTMRFLRTTMLDALRQDYVRTAWSKGLREKVVILRHVLRNAAIPVVTVVSGHVGVMIGGAVIMEEIFSLPGMGRMFIAAIRVRDYTAISGLNLFFATFGVFMILFTDLTYAYLDPRIRYK